MALPALLAGAFAVISGHTTHRRVFRITTIALLLAAVAFHEGAICVVLAAPLVYAVAHGTAALVRLCLAGPRTLAVAAVARGLEHVHFGWAYVGWLLRLPVVDRLAQLVRDALIVPPHPARRRPSAQAGVR